MANDNIYQPILRSMLESLAKSRIEKKGWKDAEEESGGTQVFKIAESLRPFYLYALSEPGAPLLLPPDVLKADTEFIFKTIRRNGFFPSPYSAVETDDQYTDFAAFSLEFADLFVRFASSKKNIASTWNLTKGACEIARKAFDFLSNPDYRLEDDRFNRWGGTTTHTRPGKAGTKEFFTDTYFTAVATIALNKALESPALTLQGTEKDDVKRLIQKSGAWIADRADANLLTGDEKRTNRKLLYSTWGLRALVETYDLQEATVRQLTRSSVSAYLNVVEDTLAQGPVSITQEYLYPCSAKLDNTPLPYEDRSSWAGVLLTLLSLSNVKEFEVLLEDCAYVRTLDNVLNGVLSLRDTATDVWYKEYPILSIHSYLAEAFLYLLEEKHTLRYSFEVTAALVSRTMKEALEDPRLLKTLQQVFYEKLERNARMKAQGDQMSTHLSPPRQSGKGRKRT